MDRSFFERDSCEVARELLGCELVRGDLRGRIVETEAYYGSEDPASHAFNGRTARNAVMFGEPGRAYVYLNYGIHCLFNIVTEKKGVPGAVLVRAAEPLEGIEAMRENRGRDEIGELCSGPGKLTEAFGIDRSMTGEKVTGGDLRIEEGQCNGDIACSGRIGISGGEELQYRFYVEGNRSVSR